MIAHNMLNGISITDEPALQQALIEEYASRTQDWLYFGETAMFLFDDKSVVITCKDGQNHERWEAFADMQTVARIADTDKLLSKTVQTLLEKGTTNET